MALIMKYIDSINRYMDHYGDSRTRDWAMMSSPFPTLAVCLTYVYLVKVLGPRIMENRKPFQLQNTLVLYNLFQVIFSAWLFYESLMGGWWGQYSFRCQPVDYSDSPTAKRIGISGWFTGHYNFRCQPVDYSNHPRTLRMANVCWWYYFSKFTEFFDTIFFVLRKKTSQVSTLHVIHHGCMPMSVWFGVKFTPGGHSTFFGLLNTFVHIVMYSYYLFAAMGPQFQKYLWWKKYLTALQMVQFVLIMSHAFQLLFIECNYPKAFVWWIGMHAVLFFFLFNQFYKDTYKTNELRKAKLKAQRLEQERLLQEQQQQQQQQQLKQQNGTLTNGYQNGKISNGLNGHIESNGSITSNGYTHNQQNGHITSNGHAGYTNGDILNKTLHELSTKTTTDNSRTDDQINNGYRKIINDDNIEITQRKIQK